MDISDLRIFRTVVEEGGITRAAERLNRVQSNVTKRVRQLEDDLGVPLFIREGRSLKVAPAGRVLVDYADRILALADEARAAVDSGVPRGVFRLGAMESTAAVRLPPILTSFAKSYPQVTLELRTGNPVTLSQAVLNGEVEAAFIAEPVSDRQLAFETAFVEEVVLVTGAEHPAIDGADSMPETVLVFEHGCPHRRRLEEFQRSLGIQARRVIELGSYHAMLGCVIAGMGTALVPRSVLASYPQVAHLKTHPLATGPQILKTLLVWRSGFETPRIGALRASLGENA